MSAKNGKKKRAGETDRTGRTDRSGGPGNGDRSKKRRSLFHLLPLWLRILLPTTALLILIGAVGLPLLPRLGIDLGISLGQHTRTSESDILLTRVRPLLKLTTVEYTYNSVFPYDFIPEGVDILRAYRRVVQEEQVTMDEKRAAELYRLCAETGIRIWSQDYAFVVITTNVKGGYDLEKDSWPETGTGETAIQTNPTLGTVSILLPPARITDFILRDETSSLYRYPDIEVDAEEWKKISEYVETHIRERVINEGILEKTDGTMRELITRVLKESGWEKISFRSRD